MIISLVLACFVAPKPSSSSIDSGLSTEEPQENQEIEAYDPIQDIDPSLFPAGDNPCREPILVSVTYVVDGDTFYASGAGGEEKVRIIGINTPEIGYDGDESDCYAEEALTIAQETLDNKEVWLTFDRDCVDSYDRTLAYVHRGLEDLDFFERRMLQGGYAFAFPFSNTDSFETMFAADEQMAQDAEAGGWAACGW